MVNDPRPYSSHATEPFAPTPAITTYKEAIIKHDAQVANNPDELAIYTDGSGINGKIGSAAVIPDLRRAKFAYLGLEKS